MDQREYEVTSRFVGTVLQHDCLKKHFKSRNSAFNIPRRNEPVAIDTVFSDTPAINDQSAMAQFFVGKNALVCDAYGMKVISSLSTHFMTTSRPEVLWIPISQMVERMIFPRKLLISSRDCSLNNMKQNPITSTKINLNSAMVLSRGP